MKNGIQKIIAEFKEIVSTADIKFNIDNTPVKPVKRLLKLFDQIEDVRRKVKVTYPLGELLLLAFIAIMANADSFVLIEQYCISKIALLRKFTPLKNGVPSHDTFRRVFTLLSPESLQKATVEYLIDNINLMRRAFDIDLEGLRHLCVDGKTANGSGRLHNTEFEIPKIHTLHVYDNTNSICLISKPVGEKTNEIPEAQAVLKCLDLKNVVVTFDAMNTQKETVGIIVKQKGHYLGALKANHPEFLNEVTSYLSPARLAKIKSSKSASNYLSYSEKAHNCVETRTLWLSKNVDWIAQCDEWANLKSIIRYEKKSVNIRTNKETVDVHFYITSLTDVRLCADVIREHWSVLCRMTFYPDHSLNPDNTKLAA